MKIDFSASINDLDDTPIELDGKALTLRTLAVNSLLAALPRSDGMPEQQDGTEKVRFAVLAQAIHTSTAPLDLKAEDIALLKERIGKAYQPLAVMQAWTLLDPPAKKS